jgi:hypothetical protein
MQMMKVQLWESFIEFVVLMGLMLLVPAFVGLDALVLHDGASEGSIVELSQEFLILLSAILCGIAAWSRPSSRGFLTLLSGLFGCMFIRECDAFFDRINHGFWVYPLSALAITTILITCVFSKNITRSITFHTGKRYFSYISTGLLLTVTFSRTFGSSHLWRSVMGADYQQVYKSLIQEGLELLGYIHITYGTLLLFKYEMRLNRQCTTSQPELK